MKRLLLTLLFLSLFSGLALQAQDFEYTALSGEDTGLKNTKLDSNANAMVIKEFGTASMFYNNTDFKLCIDFVYHVRIKIFNKNGYKHGNIAVPLRTQGEDEEELRDLMATTINMVNGSLVETELDKKQLFIDRKNKYYALAKFTMPNLKDGSIIEYRYVIHSPFLFNFRTWDFQSDIPKLHSEYIAYIPAIYNYNVSLRGMLKLTSQNAELNKAGFRLYGKDFDCSKMTYIMDNVPAFIEEDYMTAASNFKAAMYFELSDYYDDNGSKKGVTKTWKDVDYELTSDKSFGGQMKKKDVFEPLLPAILANTSDELSKAKAIYAYINKNIKSNGFIGIYGENGAKKALETHSGNTGDINLALIAALNAANLNAEAVILSIRGRGMVNSLFPVLSDFSYVVAKVNIGDQSYLLDASEPLLPFGMLPMQCMNGQGRVINFKKASYWYDLKAGQKDATRYVIEGELTQDGMIKGKLTTSSSGYSALEKRLNVGKAGSIDDYVDHLDEQMPSIKITSHEISGLDSLENPLVETYQIEMKVYDNMKGEKFFFNPFFINRTTKNPFNLNERLYPVDLGTQKEERLTLLLKFPEGFTLEDKPKDMAMSLADGGGKYLSMINFDGTSLVVNRVFQLNKPVYEAEEYLSLKEFFSRMIQSEKTDIIFNKSK